MDLAILGTGLMPFGRHDGVTPIEMGVAAAPAALEDAGLGWSDIQLAFSGSLEVLQPDTMIQHMGLTGIPFTTLYNGCATGGNLLLSAANAITAGAGDGRVVGAQPGQGAEQLAGRSEGPDSGPLAGLVQPSAVAVRRLGQAGERVPQRRRPLGDRVAGVGQRVRLSRRARVEGRVVGGP